MLFEFQIAAGHALAESGEQFPCKDAADVRGYKRALLCEGLEFILRADAVRRAAPDGVEHGMEELAALGGGQAGLGRFPALRGQARGGEGLEGALRLGGEHGGAAMDLAGREWNATGILERNREGLPARRRLGQRLRHTGKLRDQARGAGFDAVDLPCIAEMDLRGGGREAGGNGLGQIPVELGGGMRHGGAALHVERQEGVRGAAGRPGVLAGAEEPDGIGGEAGRLCWPGNLDRRVLGFGGEEGFVEGADENGEEVRPENAAAIESQRAGGFDSLLKAADGLELGGR